VLPVSRIARRAQSTRTAATTRLSSATLAADGRPSLDSL
jgi:hypothetical protein